MAEIFAVGVGGFSVMGFFAANRAKLQVELDAGDLLLLRRPSR
jgi:hypothetical protein